MTCTRSSYMEPVTSKTKARVDAPSGMSCPAQDAADSAKESHSSRLHIAGARPRQSGAKSSLGGEVGAAPGEDLKVGMKVETSGSRRNIAGLFLHADASSQKERG